MTNVTEADREQAKRLERRRSRRAAWRRILAFEATDAAYIDRLAVSLAAAREAGEAKGRACLDVLREMVNAPAHEAVICGSLMLKAHAAIKAYNAETEP